MVDQDKLKLLLLISVLFISNTLMLINYFSTKHNFKTNQSMVRINSEVVCEEKIFQFLNEENKFKNMNKIEFTKTENKNEIKVTNKSFFSEGQTDSYFLQKENKELTHCYDQTQNFNVRCGIYLSETKSCLDTYKSKEKCQMNIEDLEKCNIYEYVKVSFIVDYFLQKNM